MMMETMNTDHLSIPQRLDLIEHIWNSLPERMEMDELPEWHVAELSLRRAEAAANPGVGRPWRDVLGQIGATS